MKIFCEAADFVVLAFPSHLTQSKFDEILEHTSLEVAGTAFDSFCHKTFGAKWIKIILIFNNPFDPIYFS